jgi:hypothetical protein
MKAWILTFAVTLAVLSAAVMAAPIFPLPIAGRVTGLSDPTNLEVKITNLRTGVIQTTRTADLGYYLYDWANSFDNSGLFNKFLPGDQFVVSLSFCVDNPVCTKTVSYSGQPEIDAYFDVSMIPTTVTTTTIPVQTCPSVPIDWYAFLLGGGAIALLAFLATALGAYKNKARIQIYKKFTDPVTKKNTYKWVTLFQREDKKADIVTVIKKPEVPK